jgi:myo-inositol-1(or 4)-monophosphatase
MHPMLNTAVKAARRAGSVIMRHLDRLDRITVEQKSRADYVSEVDRLAEAEIIQILHQAYPDTSILGEESGAHAGNDFCWIIDPLDGTTNFLRGFPHFAVSIALRHKDKLEQGVIFDPLKNELFTASRGNGAYLNDRRMRVSRTQQMEHALIGTGFPYRSQAYANPWLASLRTFVSEASGFRRSGSAALDLAYVACGRYDGFWEFSLKPWDVAAGCLMIQEAGGLVSDIRGNATYLESGNLIAGNPRIHAEMLSRIVSELGPDVVA